MQYCHVKDKLSLLQSQQIVVLLHWIVVLFELFVFSKNGLKLIVDQKIFLNQYGKTMQYWRENEVESLFCTSKIYHLSQQ